MNCLESFSTSTIKSDSLEGRRALVTGANGGVGKTIVLQLLEAGTHVIAHHRSHDDDLVNFFEERDVCGQLSTIAADLSDPVAVGTMAETALDQFGTIDIIVNNAATAGDYKDFQQLPIRSLQDALNTNLVAPFLIVQKLWPALEYNKYGRIINISSVAARHGGSRKGLHYVTAKGGLDTMTLALSKFGAPNGILVNSVRCGIIDSGMHLKVPGYTENDYSKRVARVPVGRSGTPEEVAALVTFLAGKNGDFITGQIIDVAGGD